jgi:hypothetical protein
METNLYTATIIPMMRSLENLSKILTKAEEFADSRKTERHDFREALLNDRLVFDQFPLVRQVQIACDNGKAAAARLSGAEPPSMEDTEKTFAELQARIVKTLEYMRTVTPESIVGRDEEIVPTANLKRRYGVDTLNGHEYASRYILPNFYFHVATAYGILRKNGVPLGKADYLGSLT